MIPLAHAESILRIAHRAGASEHGASRKRFSACRLWRLLCAVALCLHGSPLAPAESILCVPTVTTPVRYCSVPFWIPHRAGGLDSATQAFALSLSLSLTLSLSHSRECGVVVGGGGVCSI